MKLITYIHRPLCAALLGAGVLALLPGCSAVYEDLDPCRNDAQVKLKFTRNMVGEDRFASDVHCARVFLYDEAGRYLSTHTPDGSDVKITLTAGKYHAIAFGGMHCEDSSFGFNLDTYTEHNYFDLCSELGGTRAAVTESASPLHPHFQSHADFSIEDLPNAHVPVTIDLTKNTNHIVLQISYKDGFPITQDAFTATIAADNAVIGHDGKIKKQGTPVVYKAYDNQCINLGTDVSYFMALNKEFDIAKIDAEDSPVLTITSKDQDGKVVCEKKLVELLQEIKKKELPEATMEEYLDRQDSWTISIGNLEPGSGFAGAEITINGWTTVLNEFEF